ncbi:MAG: DUF4124 domain-containing protein [Pseudomonas sp.]
MMLRSFILVVTGLAFSASALGQAPLYRYVDDKGVTVLDNRVPPEFVSRGYEVLDSQGRVRQVIPAAPTAEEIQASREARAEQARQLQVDTTLLRMYSSKADLDRAHARQLAQIENLIESTENSIASLQVQREELQRRAAVQERAGNEINPQVLKELADVDAETRRLERLISAKTLEIEEVSASFAIQRARLGFLLGDKGDADAETSASN